MPAGWSAARFSAGRCCGLSLPPLRPHSPTHQVCACLHQAGNHRVRLRQGKCNGVGQRRGLAARGRGAGQAQHQNTPPLPLPPLPHHTARVRPACLHRPALRLHEEVEDDGSAVVQEQQVLGLKVAHTLRRSQVALPHLHAREPFGGEAGRQGRLAECRSRHQQRRAAPCLGPASTRRARR